MPMVAQIVLPPSPSSEGPNVSDPQLAVVAANVPDDECAICLATLGPCVTTPCGHNFHAACLEHYFHQSRQPGQRSRCPLCRASVHAPLPIEVRAVSGLPIEAIAVPPPGSRCHFDRPYRFLHLGDFAKPSMLYLLTCNDDRKTSRTQVMWIIEASVPCTVHLQFRSEMHVANGRAEGWLRAKGYAPNGAMHSTSSSGVPNGPYSGPVYSKPCAPGTIELMGSDNWEGTYFVFVELSQPRGGEAAEPVDEPAGPPAQPVVVAEADEASDDEAP